MSFQGKHVPSKGEMAAKGHEMHIAKLRQEEYAAKCVAFVEGMAINYEAGCHLADSDAIFQAATEVVGKHKPKE